jgi:DNA-directed RNA polymerase subunit RPC12/RpoP
MERKYKFVSNRTLKNSKEEEKGRMRVLVRIDSDTAETDYECPECGFKERVGVEWKRPFSVKCSRCSFLMRLPKLKDEMKKEKKRRKR